MLLCYDLQVVEPSKIHEHYAALPMLVARFISLAADFRSSSAAGEQLQLASRSVKAMQ